MVDWRPSVLFLWLLFVGAYLYIIGPLRRRSGAPLHHRQIASFMIGALVLIVALQSPLDYLAERYLLTAHMVQHMLLVLVVAPLLLAGTPGWFLRPIVHRSGLWPVARFVTQPILALLLFHVAYTAYHLPTFYVASLTSEPLHALMHLVFLATAVLTWWPLLSPLPDLPRLSYPLRMLYVCAKVVLDQPVAALISLAPEPLYSFYASAPRVVGLTPLEDQQIAGLVMWVGGSLFYFLLLTAIFFRWALGAEASAKARA